MIRFGVIVTVVVAAVGLLIVGAVAGELTLVYVSIALAAVALLMLIVGVAIWRDQVFAGSPSRDERELAPVGAGGQASRTAGGLGAPNDWHEWSAPVPGPGTHGGDPREFRPPIGALPERAGPPERDRHGGEPRGAEQLPRPADETGRPRRESPRRDRSGRWSKAPDGPRREPAAAEWADRAVPGDQPRQQAAEERPRREPGPADRPAREAPSGTGERVGREAAADVRREPAPARRTDRAEQYPTVPAAEHFGPADDPTRLAHRLDSLADFARSAAPDAGAPAPSPPGLPGSQRRPSRAETESSRRPGAVPAPGADQPTILTNSAPAESARGGTRAAEDNLAPSPAVSPAAAEAAPAATMPAATTGGVGRGPGRPAEPGASWPRPAQGRSDDTRAVSAPGSSVWSRTPSGPDARSEPEFAVAESSGTGSATPPATSPVPPEMAPTMTALSAPAPAVAAAPATPAPSADPTSAVAAKADDAGGSADAIAAGAAPAGAADTTTAAADGGSAAAAEPSPDDQVSVVPGIARYHKADCILIRFLGDDDLEVVSRREAEATGCAPCRACRPDRPSAGS